MQTAGMGMHMCAHMMTITDFIDSSSNLEFVYGYKSYQKPQTIKNRTNNIGTIKGYTTVLRKNEIKYSKHKEKPNKS